MDAGVWLDGIVMAWLGSFEHRPADFGVTRAAEGGKRDMSVCSIKWAKRTRKSILMIYVNAWEIVCWGVLYEHPTLRWRFCFNEMHWSGAATWYERGCEPWLLPLCSQTTSQFMGGINFKSRACADCSPAAAEDYYSSGRNQFILFGFFEENQGQTSIKQNVLFWGRSLI